MRSTILFVVSSCQMNFSLMSRNKVTSQRIEQASPAHPHQRLWTFLSSNKAKALDLVKKISIGTKSFQKCLVSLTACVSVAKVVAKKCSETRKRCKLRSMASLTSDPAKSLTSSLIEISPRQISTFKLSSRSTLVTLPVF